MTQSIRSLMAANPMTMSATSSVAEAASGMRHANIGDIIVVDGDRICGILTDRDIIVRAVAEGRDIASPKLADMCSQELTMLAPTDSVEEAICLMLSKTIRRLPVVEGGKPVGIVSIRDLAVSHASIGDLAVSQDPRSAVGQISAARPSGRNSAAEYYAACRGEPAFSTGSRTASCQAAIAGCEEGEDYALSNISGSGVAIDDDFCPHCHVLLKGRDDYKVCPLCRYDTRQHGLQRRIRRQRRW